MGKAGKTTGPDGLPAINYKMFEEELLVPLQITLNLILTEGEMPDSWKEADITL